jgi:pyruvate dehydrogenase E1 component beta subunit
MPLHGQQLTNVPLVVWAALNADGIGAALGDSRHAARVPGLGVAQYALRREGLLLSAIIDNNPVCVFEHRWLMKDGVVRKATACRSAKAWCDSRA